MALGDAAARIFLIRAGVADEAGVTGDGALDGGASGAGSRLERAMALILDGRSDDPGVMDGAVSRFPRGGGCERAETEERVLARFRRLLGA